MKRRRTAKAPLLLAATTALIWLPSLWQSLVAAASASSSSPSFRTACNICGCADCIIGNPTGQVTTVAENKNGRTVVTRDCQTLQQEAAEQDSSFCNKQLWKLTMEPCACQSPEGIALSSLLGLASSTASSMADDFSTRRLEENHENDDDDDTNTTMAEPFFGIQWTMESPPTDNNSNNNTSGGTLSYVSAMALDTTRSVVYMVGNVGVRDCWLGALDLETQHLQQQILSAANDQDENNNDLVTQQACHNLLVLPNDRLVALGHATAGGGLLKDLLLDDDPKNLEPGAQIYGMVLDLELSPPFHDLTPPGVAQPKVTQQQQQHGNNIFAHAAQRQLNIFAPNNEPDTMAFSDNTNSTTTTVSIETEVLSNTGNITTTANNETEMLGNSNTTDSNGTTDETTNSTDPETDLGGNSTAMNDGNMTSSHNETMPMDPELPSGNSTGADLPGPNGTDPQDGLNSTDTGTWNETNPDNDTDGFNSTDSTNSTDYDADGNNSTAPTDGNYTSPDLDANSTDTVDSNSTMGTDTNSTNDGSNYTATPAPIPEEDSNSTNWDTNATAAPTPIDSNSTFPDGNGTDWGDWNNTDTNATLPGSNSTGWEDWNQTDTNTTAPDGNTTDFDDSSNNSTDWGDWNNTDTNSTAPDSNSTGWGDSNQTNANTTVPDGNTTDYEDGSNITIPEDFNATMAPTPTPSDNSTLAPTLAPTENSTIAPTSMPTDNSTMAPTLAPTENSTLAPTQNPTENSTMAPTSTPSDLGYWNQTDSNTTAPDTNFTGTPAPIPEEDNTNHTLTGTPTFSPTDLHEDDGGNSTNDLMYLLPRLRGGRTLQDSAVVFPFHLTSDGDFAYIASLESTAANNSANPLLDYSKVGLIRDAQFFVKISALPLQTTSSQASVHVKESLSPPAWSTTLTPVGSGSVLGIGGIVMLGNTLFVVGTTAGEGSAFGLEHAAGDIDGFVTKLSKETGDLVGVPYRAHSNTTADIYIHGLCASTHGESFIYVTGSSFDSTGGNETHAFLTKLRAVDLEQLWTVNLRADHASDPLSPPAVGVSCAVSNDESFVYFVGNIQNGGFIVDDTIPGSAGGTDVFIAKVHGETGDILFVRQIGSPGDDFVAPGRSVSMNADGAAIVAGSSNGNLFNIRNETSSSAQYDGFVAIITEDGSVPWTFPPPVSTAAPTTTPANVSTANPVNETPTPAPTASPTIAKERFAFKGLRLRLEGARPLTTESRLDFEKVTEEFYRMFFDLDAVSRRRLQNVGVEQFSTQVTTSGESPDNLGNIIKYEQSIAFVSASRNASADNAKSLIVAPFESVGSRKIYLDMLRESNEEFQSIIAVEEPEFTTPDETSPVEPEPKNTAEEAGGPDIMLFFFIVVGAFGLCMLIGIAYIFNRVRPKNKKQENPAVKPGMPTVEVAPRAQRRLSRAKNPGDYSASYLKDLDDFGNIGNARNSGYYSSEEFSSSFPKGDINASFSASQMFNDFNASQDFSSSQEKLRVNLPQTRSRSSSRESFRARRSRSTSQDSCTTPPKNFEDEFDEEIQTPTRPGIIADLDDEPILQEQHSDSYNSFFETFQEDDEVEEFEPYPSDLESAMEASVRMKSRRASMGASTIGSCVSIDELGSGRYGQHVKEFSPRYEDNPDYGYGDQEEPSQSQQSGDHLGDEEQGSLSHRSGGDYLDDEEQRSQSHRSGEYYDDEQQGPSQSQRSGDYFDDEEQRSQSYRSGEYYDDDQQDPSQSQRSGDYSGSDSDSEPHIKVEKNNQDMSSFTYDSFGDQLGEGF